MKDIFRYTVFPVCALFFLLYCIWGLPRVFDSARYSIPTVGRSDVVERVTTTGIALRPDETTNISGYTYDSGGFVYCLHWEAAKGRGSVAIDVQIHENDRWFNVGPEPMCIRNTNYDVTLTNVSEEIQFVRMRMVRSPKTNLAGYGFSQLFARRANSYHAPPLDKITDYPTIADVKAEGAKYLAFAGLAATAGAFSIIPLPVIVGILYNIGRAAFPSAQARRVKREAKRAASGADFQGGVTKGYDAPAPNSFRRKQDADDMKDIAADLAKETARMTELAERKEAAANLRIEEKERLTSEYEKTVRRLKAAQERYEKEQGGK